MKKMIKKVKCRFGYHEHKLWRTDCHFHIFVCDNCPDMRYVEHSMSEDEVEKMEEMAIISNYMGQVRGCYEARKRRFKI